MDKKEIQSLCDYMHKVADEVPNGLSSLADAVTFAILDLTAYYRYNVKGKDFEKALAFGRSIPHVEDLDTEEFTSWMLNDVEHLKYMPL